MKSYNLSRGKKMHFVQMYKDRISVSLSMYGTNEVKNFDLDAKTFWHYYTAELYFKEEVTLKNFFDIIYNLGPEIVSILSKIHNFDFQEFYNELNSNEKENDELTHLVYRLEYSLSKDNLYRQPVFFAQGKTDHYCLSSRPIYEFKNLNIKIENSTTFGIANKNDVVPEIKTHPKLNELIDAIFFEIGFFGSIENREKEVTELKRRVDNIENTEFFTMEEVMKKLGLEEK